MIPTQPSKDIGREWYLLDSDRQQVVFSIDAWRQATGTCLPVLSCMGTHYIIYEENGEPLGWGSVGAAIDGGLDLCERHFKGRSLDWMLMALWQGMSDLTFLQCRWPVMPKP